MEMEAKFSAPANPDDRSEGSSGEVGQHVLQDPLSLNTAFYVTDLGPGESGLESTSKRSGGVHFDLDIPNVADRPGNGQSTTCKTLLKHECYKTI